MQAVKEPQEECNPTIWESDKDPRPKWITSQELCTACKQEGLGCFFHYPRKKEEEEGMEEFNENPMDPGTEEHKALLTKEEGDYSSDSLASYGEECSPHLITTIIT